MTNSDETDFFIIILTRAVQTSTGYKLVKNETIPTNDVYIRYTNNIPYILYFHIIWWKLFLKFTFFRDSRGVDSWFQAISVIEFNGTLSPSCDSNGHYLCDIKDKSTDSWFRTSDENQPTSIQNSEVSKFRYVVLYKRA